MKFYKTLTINGVEYPLAVPISGIGVPTIEAEIGMFYTNVTTGDVYRYTANGWELLSCAVTSNDDLEAALDAILLIQDEILGYHTVKLILERCENGSCDVEVAYYNHLGERITRTVEELDSAERYSTYILEEVASNIDIKNTDGPLRVSVDGEVLYDSTEGSLDENGEPWRHSYTLTVTQSMTVDIYAKYE